MLLDASTSGRLQVTAGASLLECSKLVMWDRDRSAFAAVPFGTFRQRWRGDVHQVFGRLICWITFSAGAEFLAKGVCLLHGVDRRKSPRVLDYPSEPLPKWVYKVVSGTAPEVPVPHHGQLRDLWLGEPKKQVRPALEGLCSKLGASSSDREALIAAYRLLGSAIRNRDAHAYVPKVRDDHFWLVADLFVPRFNLLVSWIPGGASILGSWIDVESAERFVAGLPPGHA